MPGALSGLGQIGSAFGGSLPDAQAKWAQVQLLQQQAQEAQRVQAARGLFARYLMSQSQNPNNPPMPGQGSQPLGLPGAQPFPQSGPGGQAGSVSSAGSPTAPSPPGSAPAPSFQGGASSNPLYGQFTIPQMMQWVKTKNPNVDDATAFDLIGMAQAYLKPDQQQQFQQMKLDMQEKIAEMKGDVAMRLGQLKSTTSINIAGMREGDRAAGRSATDARQERLFQHQDSMLAQRMAQDAANRATAQGDKVTAQKSMLLRQQSQSLTSRLDTLINSGQDESDPNSQAGKVKAQLDGINSQIMDLESNVGGSPSAATSTPAPRQYSQANPAKPTTIKDFNALPNGTYYINPTDGKVLVKTKNISGG